ncbi:MAG: ABC transporter ATP-binding protein [Nitrospirae bacterium]|nr:ABC transporter ATP-binding protein [Nitrospirota bacterium]
MNQTAIDVRNVYFNYPDGHEVLKDVSFRIGYGEKVAIIGPNGAGKSTLMSLFNGILMPTDGLVSVDSMAVNRHNLKAVRRKVGMVFQDPDDQLFCPTVYEDVAFGPENLGLPKDEISVRVNDALRLMGLSGFEGRSSFHLSFGERKRLAMATVLSYQPEILVFDEPSTNMDPSSRRRLIEWLNFSDKTIILCTHDLDIALEVCDRCLLLSGGRIVADMAACTILSDQALLKANRLELPVSFSACNDLRDCLYSEIMDAEKRAIIGNFLTRQSACPRQGRCLRC